MTFFLRQIISVRYVKPTWAAVVRFCNGETEEHKKRVQVMEQKLKEENQRRDRERFELEEKKRLDDIEREKKRKELDESRNVAVKKVAAKAAAVAGDASIASTAEGGITLSHEDEEPSDLELLEAVVVSEEGLDQAMPNPRSLLVALQHKAWVESREKLRDFNQIQITVDPDLETILDLGPQDLLYNMRVGRQGRGI